MAQDGGQNYAPKPQGDGSPVARPTARWPTAELNALGLENTKHPRSRVLHDFAWGDDDFHNV